MPPEAELVAHDRLLYKHQHQMSITGELSFGKSNIAMYQQQFAVLQYSACDCLSDTKAYASSAKTTLTLDWTVSLHGKLTGQVWLQYHACCDHGCAESCGLQDLGQLWTTSMSSLHSS